MSLAELVPAAWRSALSEATAASTFQALDGFLSTQWKDAVVFPPRAQVFAALELTPPESVKVVLLGQDPYPTAGNANGLAFSVTKDVKVPASLKNVFLGLEADLGLPIPKHGDLTAWAQRGVLLVEISIDLLPQTHQHRRDRLARIGFIAAVHRAQCAQPDHSFRRKALGLIEQDGVHGNVSTASSIRRSNSVSTFSERCWSMT